MKKETIFPINYVKINYLKNYLKLLRDLKMQKEH